MTTAKDLPLAGVVVVDVSRLLPGAVLARMLLDLGARLVKVEDPATGDPLRHAPPVVDGTSAAFTYFLRGAESLCLDLSRPDGARAVRKLARSADVLVESFRVGTMERWGLGPDRLLAVNPSLTWCSLTGFGRSGEWARHVGHDLNLVASSGLLGLLGTTDGRLPGTQLADVTAGLLAGAAVLAALLRRGRTGRGTVIDQPLASGVAPLLAWVWADEAGGGGGFNDRVLAGDVPCYRVYTCQDGKKLAAGTLEPKFWAGFVEMLGLGHLAGLGLDTGQAGKAAAAEVEAKLATATRDHWVELGLARGLPVSPVDDLATARAPGGFLEATGLGRVTSFGGRDRVLPAPFIRSLGQVPDRGAPALGEHTRALSDELGLDVTDV
jgi:crotonobetainyl-CoA:carnitine CoA-transferase CaiB-like acyl-CoA transferase